MGFELTSEQQLLQNETRRYAQKHIAPGAEAREAAHRIEPELIRGLAGQGLLGVNVPAALGGSEAGAVAYALALREVAAADAAVAVTMAVTNMVAEVVSHFGTEQQRQTYVPKLTDGTFFGGAFALSEPGAGSDAAGLQTRAVPAAAAGAKAGVAGKGGWLLSGEKAWISTGDQAGVLVVWARTGDPDSGARGISAFLVPGDAPGLSAGRPEEKMGLRASHTVPLRLDNVYVPAEGLLGEPGDGFRIAMMALDGGRIGIGSQAAGMAMAAQQVAIRYSHERQQFGQPLANFQAIQFKLADMATEMDAAWLLTLRAASLKDAKVRFSKEAAMAKVMSSETANRVVREAVQILGGYGYMEESGLARLYRDCRVTQIYEGTSEIQRLVIARAVLAEMPSGL